MTDSDFILTNRTCAIAITIDMSFKTALAADFKRAYKNTEFLWKQRPGIGGVAALPPAASQIPVKYLCFLVTRATEKRHVDPENLDTSEIDHEDFMRGVTAKLGPRFFFCNLEGHFKSDCPQFWDAVADIKHPRHEEALSGVKASKASLLSEAEARRKKNHKS